MLRRGVAEGGFEGSGKGAVVGKAAGEGDFGDALGGGIEKIGGGLKSGLGDHLLRGEAEEAFRHAGEADRGHAGLTRKVDGS